MHKQELGFLCDLLDAINHNVLEQFYRTIGQGVLPHRATMTCNLNSTREHRPVSSDEVNELLTFSHKIRSQPGFSPKTVF